MFGKVFGQGSELSRRAAYGELEMDQKLIFGKIVGYQIAHLEDSYCVW